MRTMGAFPLKSLEFLPICTIHLLNNRIKFKSLTIGLFRNSDFLMLNWSPDPVQGRLRKGLSPPDVKGTSGTDPVSRGPRYKCANVN